MKTAATAIHGTRSSGCNAGFTLIEIIISLVVAGILASIAGMGIVSAVSGYAVVRENVVLSQKIQIAAARINRELLELTDITDRDGTRPYLVYTSATGKNQAIARVNDTIRLYDHPPEPVSDTYLENNGDILTDRVDSFSLTYFQGGSGWDGTDLRELSTIQFSLNLFRKDAAGSTVNVTTLVHPRNNDNYGGSTATLPATPPTGNQYSCFISTMRCGPVGFTGLFPATGWPLLLISIVWVARCLITTNGKHNLVRAVSGHVRAGGKPAIIKSFPGSGSYPEDGGSALIGIIITILVFASLGAAIVPLIGSSQLHRTAAGRSAQAYYLAESGLRYAASRYLDAGNETARYFALNDIHAVTHRLGDNQGAFTFFAHPYYFLVDTDPANTTTVVTHIYGELADGYSIPAGGGSLSIDDTVYAFTSASIAGQQITFSLTSPLTVAADTPVYPVARTSANQTVTNGGDLLLSPGSAEMFPERNGSFVMNGSSYTYREKAPDSNTLMGIKRTDGSNFPDVTITANRNIRLKKFATVTSTGAVGSGTTMASRQIVYQVQIPEKKEPVRVIFHERFDDLAKWKESVLGAHEILDQGGNNVLRVTGVTQSGADAPTASLISLDTGAVQFNPHRFDAQVKVGYDPAVPDYYTAGISFRLTEGGDKSYGLSFQRSTGKNDPSDNIYDGLKPFDEDKISAVVLWQSTGIDDKQWLAYKKISDVRLMASAQEITDAESDWPVTIEGKRVSIPVGLSPVPEIPCDYNRLKLKFLSDCTVLKISVNNGSWQTFEHNELDITKYEGDPVFFIRFQIGAESALCGISKIEIVADDFDIQNATLLARFTDAKMVEFEYNGSDTIEPDDRIVQQNGASATVYGYPLISTDNPDNGTLLLKNVNGAFEIDNISVIGKSDVARVTGFYADQYHFIKAYYGTESGCGLRTDNPLDSDKGDNPVAGELNWPPDEGKPWTPEDDKFTLIQWDAVNPDVTGEEAVTFISHKDYGSGYDYKNTIVTITKSPLIAPGSTLGLHTFGSGSLNIYFDDFGYQSVVDQPVAISQPIQY